MIKIITIIFVVVMVVNCSQAPKVLSLPSDSVGADYDTRNFRKNSSNKSDESFYQVGIASWYGGKFNGRRTSNGEIYDMYKLTAAHQELPFNTIVEVENLKNRKRVLVRINDRGPFVKDRIIDLSYKAAISLGMDEIGTAPVVLRIVDLINNNGSKKKIVVRKLEYSHKSRFYLQAGAFGKSENAESLVSRLNDSSGNVKFSVVFEDGYYKVLSDGIDTREEAENLKRFLEEYGFDTFIKEVFLSGESK